MKRASKLSFINTFAVRKLIYCFAVLLDGWISANSLSCPGQYSCGFVLTAARWIWVALLTALILQPVYTKVCLLVIECAGACESSHIPGLMVLTPTKALLLVEGHLFCG